MKDFLDYLVKSIVKNEEAVRIEESLEGDTVNLKLWVDKEDMGLVIGKEGKIIKSLRNLLRAKATREEKRINLELVEQMVEPTTEPVSSEVPEQ